MRPNISQKERQMCISLTLAVDDIDKNVDDNDGAGPADACTAGKIVKYQPLT